MRLVQALHWLRDTDTIDTRSDLVDKLRDILNHGPHAKAVRRDLVDGLQTLPFWKQAILTPLYIPEADACTPHIKTTLNQEQSLRQSCSTPPPHQTEHRPP